QEGLPNASIYPYRMYSNDDVLRYLIRYQLDPIPIPIGSYLDNMNFPGNLGGLNRSKEFTAGAPLIFNQEIPFSVSDITSQLADNGNFAPGGNTSLSEASATIYSNNLPEVTVVNGTENLNYDKIYYSTGSVQVTMNRTDSNPVTNGYTLNMKAYLVPSDFNRLTDNPETECIAKSKNGEWQNIITNPTLTIPLNVAGGIPMSFKFVFVAESANGNGSVFHTYSPTASYDNLKVKRITNLNSPNGIDLTDQDVAIPLDTVPEGFSEFTFDDATITAKSNNLSGWSGVSIDFPTSDDLKFVGTGGALKSGSSITETASVSGNYLINKTYKAAATIYPQSSGTLSVHIKPKLTITNATIDFGSDGNSNQTISAAVAFNLTKIKQAKANLTQLGITGYTLPSSGETGSVELQEELLKFVNQINFREYKTDENGNQTTTPREGFGLKCKVTNTLPAGNDISLNIKILKNGSNGYDKTVNIQAGSNNTAADWTEKECTIKFPAYQEGVKKYLDMSATIVGADNFTLNNIVLGDTYKFGLKVEDFVYDWDSVNLNLSDKSLNGNPDLPFDINSLMENFPAMVGDAIQKIEMKSFPFYLYARTPSASSIAPLFSGIELEGKMYISYKKNGANKYKDLMVTDSSESSSAPNTDRALNFISDDLPWPEDTSQLITGDASKQNNMAYYLNNEHASVSSDLKDILSLTNAQDIKLNYDLKLKNASNTTIYQSMMPTSGSEESTNLCVDLATIVSFDFGLKGPISLNIMEMTNEDYNTPDSTGKYSDLLNRTDISSETDYDEYMDLIKSVGINYQLVNRLFISDEDHKLDITINIDDRDESDYTGIHKNLVLNPGRSDVEFTKDEVKKIMTKIFHPNIKINLGRPLDTGETTDYIGNKPELKVSRSGLSDKNALSANIVVYVQMDGDQSYQVWGGRE
ncbi:MAG: hypothetical protein J5857_03105, partial [Treponema sp.]|nr:hypothetical protein [Treponema sp.]